jgi:hypothetical protein
LLANYKSKKIICQLILAHPTGVLQKNATLFSFGRNQGEKAPIRKGCAVFTAHPKDTGEFFAL